MILTLLITFHNLARLGSTFAVIGIWILCEGERAAVDSKWMVWACRVIYALVIIGLWVR